MHPSPPTYDPQDSDTGEIRRLGLTSPSRARHTWIGVCIGISALLWIGSIASVVITHVLELRSVTATALLIAAGTATVCSCMLATSTTSQRANVDDHRKVVTGQQTIRHDLTELGSDVTLSLSALHAEVEQLSAKVSKIDPWTIYTAVASDLLGVESRNGNGGRPGGR